MVKIRLTRLGTHKRPFYRVVVLDSRKPRNGAHLELVGYHDPLKKDTKIDLSRVDYWVGVGAQTSDTVAALVKQVRSAAVAS
jgi:small subunit ribosomal protein S16